MSIHLTYSIKVIFIVIIELIKSRIFTEKAGINNKEPFFTRKPELNFRNKLVKFYIWSIALYGAETWALTKVDQK